MVRLILNAKPDEFGKIEFSKYDTNLFCIIKTKAEHICICCGRKINKNDYCLGACPDKICLKCADILIKNALGSLEKNKIIITQLKKKIEDNLENLIKNNLVNSI